MNPPQVYMCSPSWTLLSPPSPYHPSGSSQCTSPKHPVSCIKPGLATRFIHDILHVSMPFSQIFPPSPSGWGTHVYLWRIHFDIWQNWYNYVKFKNKIKKKKKACHIILCIFLKPFIWWAQTDSLLLSC